MRFKENIGTLTKASTSQITLAGTSLLKLGGLYQSLNSPSLTTSGSGIGGLDTGSITNNTLYYVYAVSDGSNKGITASINNQSPTGFSRYKKVGAFFVGNSSNIKFVFSHLQNESTWALDTDLTSNLTTNVAWNFTSKVSGDNYLVNFLASFTGANTQTSTVTVDLPITIDSGKTLTTGFATSLGSSVYVDTSSGLSLAGDCVYDSGGNSVRLASNRSSEVLIAESASAASGGISSQSGGAKGNWISSITRTAAGTYQVNFVSGYFAVNPLVMVSCVADYNNTISVSNATPVGFTVYSAQNGTLEDCVFTIIVYGTALHRGIVRSSVNPASGNDLPFTIANGDSFSGNFSVPILGMSIIDWKDY